MPRKTLVFAILLAVGVAAGPTVAQESRVPFVYVSGYRPEITWFRLDTARGTLVPADTRPNVARTVILGVRYAVKFCSRRTRPILAASGPFRSISRPARDADDDVPSTGSITAHLSTDRTGRWLLVANYGGDLTNGGVLKQGTIASMPIGADGRLGAAVDTREFGIGTMAHQIRSDPGNRFVYVPLKGGPAVAQLIFDPATGR